MNSHSILQQLTRQYPSRTIIKNNDKNPTEIICEIEPTNQHKEYSVAITIIDQSVPHYHKKSTETYEVLKGNLIVTIDGITHSLNAGDSFVIRPNSVHWATGHETWAKVSSKPGWTQTDHFTILSV